MIEKSFIEFLSTKFGIMLCIFVLFFLAAAIQACRKWDDIAKFLIAIIDTSNSVSVTSTVLLFHVIVSSLCVWPLWVLLSIMDNIDNTPGMPFTMVDIPAGVLSLYGIANGIAVAGSAARQFAQRGDAVKATATAKE